MTPYFHDQARGITIYCARWEEVWPTLGLAHENVALCWADAPYGVKEKTKRGSRGNRMAPRSSRPGTGRDWPEVEGDDSPFDPAPLLAFPRLVLWGANHFANRLPASPSWWAWDKREGTTSDDNADGELAWTNLGGPARFYSHLWRGFIRAGRMNQTAPLHPTEKPPELASWGFQRAGLRGADLVFSPYMGSGPEARAAMDLGLRFIGCEIVEEYCAAAVSRLRQLTLL